MSCEVLLLAQWEGKKAEGVVRGDKEEQHNLSAYPLIQAHQLWIAKFFRMQAVGRVQKGNS